MKTYICNNDRCGWDGDREDCVSPKHDLSQLLCPECHETVEGVDGHSYVPHNPALYSGQDCHECGLLPKHPIHHSASGDSDGKNL